MRTGESVESRPALHRGILYAATLGGNVVALRAQDGKPVWTAATKLESAVQAPLAVDARQVYVATAPSSLVALDRATGKPSWRYTDDLLREFYLGAQSRSGVPNPFAPLPSVWGRVFWLRAIEGGRADLLPPGVVERLADELAEGRAA